MNRRIYSLSIAAMLAGASLLSALPASAQTNSDGYTIYTQNFDGTTPTPTGSTATGATGYGTVTAGSSTVINGLRSANYGYATLPTKSTVTVAGTTQTVGGTTFTNRAYSGTQAANVTWQAASTVTSSAPGFEGFTSASAFNQRPTVDLGSVVSFNIYVFSSAGASVDVALEMEENSTNYYNADSATPTVSSTVPSSASAQPDILGMRSYDNPETDLWVVGTTGSSKTPNAQAFPTGGKLVTSGSWQTVTFNLPTEDKAYVLGTLGYHTSGLGSLNGIDFTPVNPASGEVFSVYIDNLTIGGVAAPEPSEWAAMGIGAVALLGLAVRARRRSSGLTAA